MRATLKLYRQSPRKVRLVADLIRGKNVERAIRLLKFTNKKAAGGVKKVLESAIANAKDAGSDTERLVVEKITVNKGTTLKRHIPRARGRATPINKRTSHIYIELK